MILDRTNLSANRSRIVHCEQAESNVELCDTSSCLSNNIITNGSKGTSFQTATDKIMICETEQAEGSDECSVSDASSCLSIYNNSTKRNKRTSFQTAVDTIKKPEIERVESDDECRVSDASSCFSIYTNYKSGKRSHRSIETAAFNKMMRPQKSIFTPMATYSSKSLNASKCVAGKFRKSSCRRSTYINVPKLIPGPLSLDFNPIRLGGVVKLQNPAVTVTSSNTCCIDSLLMVLVVAFREDKMFSDILKQHSGSNTSIKCLITCIETMSTAGNEYSAILARTKYILHHPSKYFALNNLVVPRSVKKIDINLDQPEHEIAWIMLKDICLGYRNTNCSRDLCEKREFARKFISIQGFDDIKHALISELHEVTSVCNLVTKSNDFNDPLLISFEDDVFLENGERKRVM